MKAVLLLALMALGGALAQTEKMGIWVPLYVLPRGPKETRDEYNSLIETADAASCHKGYFKGTVLTGPDSGPPRDPQDFPFFASRFEVVANTSQWQGFGYVTTKYGERPLEEVKKDIAIWLDTDRTKGFGYLVQGIWVDNVRSDLEGYRAYYAEIAALIKSYNKIVAFNPGMTFNDCDFLVSNGVEFVNNFENTYAKWLELDAKDKTVDCPCKNKGNVRCMASIHAFPKADAKGKPIAESDIREVMKRMSTRGYSAMFVTERTMPDHYLKLPSIWPIAINAACQTNIDQGNMNDAKGRRLMSEAAGRRLLAKP